MSGGDGWDCRRRPRRYLKTMIDDRFCEGGHCSVPWKADLYPYVCNLTWPGMYLCTACMRLAGDDAMLDGVLPRAPASSALTLLLKGGKENKEKNKKQQQKKPE